jgi:hypothetical protein
MINRLFFIVAFCLSNSLIFAQSSESYQWGKVLLGGGGAVPTVIAHPKVSGAVFSTHDVCGPNRWNEVKQQFEYSLSFPYWMSPQNIAGCECLTLDPNDLSGNTALLSITNQAGFNKESYLLRTTNITFNMIQITATLSIMPHETVVFTRALTEELIFQKHQLPMVLFMNWKGRKPIQVSAK